ncbi:MAG: hypothetical protein ACJ779_01570 [Chloroflexota bacterium]
MTSPGGRSTAGAVADDLTAWIDERLEAVGVRRRSAPRIERVWARATTVSFATDRGPMWAKAVPGVFAHEVAVTVLLADIDPGCVPPVVAADEDLGRIITEHVEGPTLASEHDRPDAWAATLIRLAELQRVLAAEPVALAIAGVAMAPIESLAEAVPRLLADDGLLATGRPGGLTKGEAKMLRARAPDFIAACESLSESTIPDTLDHGDLSGDEVILGEMGPVFLDWSDGSVTHPFLSAASLLADGAPGDDLAGAYLAPWIGAGIVTDAVGREALADAATVVPLHVAALYADRILPALGGEARSDPKVVAGLRRLVTR